MIEVALRVVVRREKAAAVKEKRRIAAAKAKTKRAKKIAAAEKRVEAAERALERSRVVNKFTFRCRVRLERARRLLWEARNNV